MSQSAAVSRTKQISP